MAGCRSALKGRRSTRRSKNARVIFSKEAASIVTNARKSDAPSGVARPSLALRAVARSYCPAAFRACLLSPVTVGTIALPMIQKAHENGRLATRCCGLVQCRPPQSPSLKLPVYQALVLAALFALLLSGCCTPWRGAPTIVSSSGQRLCARHRIPLITVRGFVPPPKTYLVLEPKGLRKLCQLSECYPNGVRGPYRSLWPTSICVERAPITYCPLCEAEIQKH